MAYEFDVVYTKKEISDRLTPGYKVVEVGNMLHLVNRISNTVYIIFMPRDDGYVLSHTLKKPEL